MNGSLAFRYAQHAWAFQEKLARLPDDTDPSRRAGHGLWSCVADVPDRDARTRLVARLFPRTFGPWPTLQRFEERAPRLALLDRDRLVAALCAFALAARPGALRCCISREPRQALQAVLGDAFDSLQQARRGGRAVPEWATAWTPLHWACLGLLDWATLLQPHDVALKRMAEASLPPALLRPLAAKPALPPEHGAAQAAAMLDELSVEWSC